MWREKRDTMRNILCSISFSYISCSISEIWITFWTVHNAYCYCFNVAIAALYSPGQAAAAAAAAAAMFGIQSGPRGGAGSKIVCRQ